MGDQKFEYVSMLGILPFFGVRYITRKGKTSHNLGPEMRNDNVNLMGLQQLFK